MAVPVEIVICYARKDEAFLKEFQTHLKPLQYRGMISTWHDRDISPGADYDANIKAHLEAAQLIILLMSPDFLASDYCYNIELKQALARHNRQEVTVIPIILRPCAWKQTDVGKLQALPTDGKPVANWQNQDKALLS